MFNAGQQIGSYTLIHKLGRGGFGEVWLAEKRSQFLSKKVAIKLPHDDQVDFEAVRREAELWEQASGHANVLPIIDADIYEGQVMIVSEYADGGSLSDKLRSEGKLAVKQALEMSIGILSGLEFLHNKKIIHRDIKPQNILLQGGIPRLADFGISRAINSSTVSSVIIGTDSYMAPEAFEGKRTVQTDVWSVGVVLYQLIKGSLPFPQEHPTERMYAVLTKQFEPFPPDVSPILVQIIGKALAKNTEQRYSSAAAMREDLRIASNDPAALSRARTANTAGNTYSPAREDETVVRTSDPQHVRPSAPPPLMKETIQMNQPRYTPQAQYPQQPQYPQPQYAPKPLQYTPRQAPNLYDSGTTLPSNGQKVLAGFCYLGNFVCAIGAILSIISLITNKDKFSKFHAIQSLIFYVLFIAVIIVLNVLGAAAGTSNRGMPTLIVAAFVISYLTGFITFIYCAVRAFQGHIAVIPGIGSLADKWSGLVSQKLF